MFELFFDLKGTVNRSTYFQAAALVSLVFGLSLWMLLSGPWSPEPSSFSLAAVGAVIDHPVTSAMQVTQTQGGVFLIGITAIAICFWSFAALSLKRTRDAQTTPHWMWLGLFFPPAYLVILLLFFPSRDLPIHMAE